MMLTTTLDGIVMLMDVRRILFNTKSKWKTKGEKVSKVDASVRYVDEDTGTRFI